MAGQVYPTAPVISLREEYKMQGASIGPLPPPPATYSKPSQRRHRHGGRRGGRCCCLLATLCSILLAVIYLLGVFALVLWLVLRPIHAPTYSIDELRIKSFSLSSTNTSLTADFVYNITANNPNKKIGIKYNYINIATSYDGQVFGNSSIPSFSQGHRNITALTTEFDVNNFAITQSSGSQLAAALQSQSPLSVPIHIEANAKVHVTIGKYTSFPFKVRVECDVNVGNGFPQSISIDDLAKKCTLKRMRY